MSSDKVSRIKRTAFQALIGLLISIVVPFLLAVTNAMSVEFKDYAWWPVVATVLTTLVATVQNMIEDYKDGNTQRYQNPGSTPGG